jgi:hypothetical protein
VKPEPDAHENDYEGDVAWRQCDDARLERTVCTAAGSWYDTA